MGSLGEEKAVEYLLSMRFRNCTSCDQIWYSEWVFDLSTLSSGGYGDPRYYISNEIKALYWAYLIYSKKTCYSEYLGVVIERRYGRKMFDLQRVESAEPDGKTLKSLLSIDVRPIDNDVSKWNPDLYLWRDEWLEKMRAVGLDSLRHEGVSPVHPGYLFIAYTRPTMKSFHTEQVDIEKECPSGRHE